VHQYVPPESVEEQWDLPGLEKVLADEWGIELGLQQQVRVASAITDEDIVEKVIAAAHAAFDAKVEQVGEQNFTHFERMVLLQSIDSHWREHLAALDYLRQGIHLRGYAQKQPKQEYKREAFELFGQMLDAVKNEVTKVLMTVKVQSSEQLEQAAEDLEERAERIANVTYTAPTETGEVESRLDESTAPRAAGAQWRRAAWPWPWVKCRVSAATIPARAAAARSTSSATASWPEFLRDGGIPQQRVVLRLERGAPGLRVARVRRGHQALHHLHQVARHLRHLLGDELLDEAAVERVARPPVRRPGP
jgi:hypothetical protein